MLLKNLIKDISEDKRNISISGIASNSMEVKKNYIFFAIKGNKINGEKFIQDAVKKGASVIICSKQCKYKNKNVQIIRTNDIRYFLSEISSRFYKLKPKKIIAVTGTNGKTSVADIFHQILRINKLPVATIGTFGIKYNGRTIKTNLTSPDTINLHKHLNFLKKKKINNVIIESSSHGLDQKRLHHINFKGAIFTNFSQDHLDYHKNMKSYLNAKLILFKKILKKNSLIISDKEIKPFSELNKISKKRNLKLLDISKDFIKIKNNQSKFMSDFKIKNLAMAINGIKLCGLKEKLIFKAIKKIKDVNGRLELVKHFSNDVKVFVDYAHTPDALLKTLKSLELLYKKKISLVFGCGGDRDQKKRPLMAKIANKHCKKIYVTDDNPRNENPKKIRQALMKYIDKNKAFNISNRASAIKKAIQNADHQEIILIAGKGHEESQIYKNKIINISDKKIVKKIKFKTKVINNKHRNFSQNKAILSQILGKKITINFHGLSTDTRKIKKDNLFVAIKGKKFDGNKFIKNALKKGAGCVICSSTRKQNIKKVIKVKEPSNFLNNFAKCKREITSAKIIAITGSAGKTSLKNLIKNIIKDFGKTYSSPRSFNNHLGVPISLSNLSYEDKFGVFEVGMSKAGEIKKLSNLVKPHIAVITNIGEAHIENFKNVNGIAKAKSEIIDNVTAQGTIILNRDDKFFNYLSKKAKLRGIKISTFGTNKKSDICLKKIVKKGATSKISIKINNKTTNIAIGDLNINNVLSTVAVLKELNIDISKVKNNFKNFHSPKGRGKKYYINRYKKKFKLIDESYNSNPLSANVAINKISSIKKEKFKKYLILGDMLELGSRSKKYHMELFKVINNSDIDKVFIKGKETIFAYKHLNKEKRGNILQHIEDIDSSLGKMISNNDYLMIKGSNATGLNDFSKKMIKGK